MDSNLSIKDRDFSKAVISLMKGVVFREKDRNLWNDLIDNKAGITDYAAVMGLELKVDESEGYAWLRTKETPEDDQPLPKLVVKRELSYPVSLIIALLRKKLAEFDASGEGSRLILPKDEITDSIRIFFPEGVNEAKFTDKIDAHLNKIADMGFIRRLKGDKNKIEVIRIIKAFVDAQWLGEFDAKLEEYRKMHFDDTENDS
ncbi:MAG: DUF4194 domain-containing protein [Thermodesulfobacteriota bacterium]